LPAREATLQALILAGGSGTRFWPASRKRRPKQLLSLAGGRTLLRRTFDRLAPIVEPGDVWVCTNRELAADVARELPELDESHILAEPEGRNTAPAIAWSVASMPSDRADEAVISLHSDHWIADEQAFRACLLDAVAAVESENEVLALGVAPRWAETGYGYIETAEPVGPGARSTAVVCFREKPDAETAEAFVASGRHLWNSGIFGFRGTTLLGLMRELQPETMKGIDEIARRPQDLGELYGQLPAEAIDTAVMERIDKLRTLVLDCGWSDLGSWEALAEILQADEAGNVVRGDAVAVDARDNLLVGEDGLVAVVGVSGLAVVKTDDAVLVIPKSRSQEVRRIVDQLRRSGRSDLL
jgi:mannose-1-phosphate guanylyltransferase